MRRAWAISNKYGRNKEPSIHSIVECRSSGPFIFFCPVISGKKICFCFPTNSNFFAFICVLFIIQCNLGLSFRILFSGLKFSLHDPIWCIKGLLIAVIEKIFQSKMSTVETSCCYSICNDWECVRHYPSIKCNQIPLNKNVASVFDRF